MTEIIDKINKELSILDEFGEDAEQLKGIYLETPDISSAIKHGKQLKANRERLVEEKRRKEAEAAEKAEAEEQYITGQPEEEPEEPEKVEVAAQAPEQQEKMTFILSGDKKAFDVVYAMSGLTVCPAMRIIGTKEQLVDLRKRLEAAGLSYEKKDYTTVLAG